jgi:subtilase family serine protease
MESNLVVRRTAISAVIAATLGVGCLLTPAAARAESWINTATQAIPLTGLSGISPLAASTPMHITVGLLPQNKAQLDAFVAQISQPGSPSFGKVLTPQQFLNEYSPTQAQANSVMSYLSQAGFTNLVLSPNRLAITADGPASVVQAAFNTNLVQFVLGGKTVYVNSTPAQIPSSLQGIVAAVVGLQNEGVMMTLLAQNEASGKAIPRPAKAPAAPAATGSGLPQILPELNASAFQTAYDAGSTPTGLGTSIGIVTTGNLSQVPLDLRQYEKENSLPQVPYSIVTTGTPSSSTSGLDEWDLDSQSSSGIAGNLRQIIFYDTASLGDADLVPDYERIVSDDQVKAVNMSFGGCETLEYLSGGMDLSDIAFEQGEAEGISFFASTGDAGAACGLLINLGLPDTGLVGIVEYPSSSPYVVAVGGTTLLIDSNNNYISELAWIAGGGGNSLWESPPSWQNGVVPLANSLTNLRGTPDVAMDADNNLSPAVIVVDGADEAVGGTSLSSPLSVGSWSRMQAAHGECYGFAAPIFYTFISGLLSPAKDFHDIILGTNGLYLATPGWDYTTGIGSFDISAVNGGLPAISCAPEVPFSLAASVAPTSQVNLSWGLSPGASSYSIYAGTASGAEGTTPIASSSGTSTVLGGLAGPQFFTVKAVNAAGSSPASNEVSVNIPMAVPAGLTVTFTDMTQVSLQWSLTANASDYYVYYGTTSGGETVKSAAITGTTTTIGGLTPGKQYYFVVEGYNHAAALSSAPSNEVSATTATLPLAPSGLTVTGSAANSVSLSWKASPDASDYYVYSGTKAGGETTKSAAIVGTSATITGLLPNTQYYFVVKAYNHTYAVSSVGSNEVGVITP